MGKVIDLVFDRLGYHKKANNEGKSSQGFKAISLVQGFGIPNFFSADATKASAIRKFGLSFGNLRRIAQYDAVIRICVNAIKNEVSQSDWVIRPKPRFEDKKSYSKAKVKQLTDFFENVNRTGENMRELLAKVLEDILILDQGVVELVRSYSGDIVGLNSVDGATIRPIINAYGDVNPAAAYAQFINEEKVVEFPQADMIMMMKSPQNDVYRYGYGLSNIESIILQVQAALNADMHNARQFSEDNIPPGMVDLGDMNDDEAKQFIALWNATVVPHNHRLKFLWGGKTEKKYTPFKQNNKDMQFVEYIDWLSRIKLATYGLTSQDANITADINRNQGEMQNDLSRSRGVGSIKKLLEEYFTREIIQQGFQIDELMFKFPDADNLKDELLQAQIDAIYLEKQVLDVNEIRLRKGLTEKELPEEPEEDDYATAKPKAKKPVEEKSTEEKPTKKNFLNVYSNVL